MYDYNFRKCHTIILSLPTHCNGTRAKEQTFSSSEHSLGLDNLKNIIASNNQTLQQMLSEVQNLENYNDKEARVDPWFYRVILELKVN